MYLSDCTNIMVMSHCGTSAVINVRLYDRQDELKTGAHAAQENLSGVLHYQPIHVQWLLVMVKWSVLNQWSFQPNSIGKRFITQSFLKLFMLWPSSGLKNEQHLPKFCDSIQLLFSHLVLLLLIMKRTAAISAYLRRIVHAALHTYMKTAAQQVFI